MLAKESTLKVHVQPACQVPSCPPPLAGKYARVGTMTAKESVRKRMESEEGISYTEFTYQLLQGYDFVHMCREMGVRVQVRARLVWVCFLGCGVKGKAVACAHVARGAHA
jgi:hypothetical protein